MLVILDRDGVLNEESDDYIKSPDEWHPLPGSLEAVVSLNKAGYTVVVATNQSGVGRGYYTEDDLAAIHAKMAEALRVLGGQVDGIYYCPHHPDDDCLCRKPAPGMLLQIAQDFPDDFASAIFVGDSLRDIQAAVTAGVQPVLVKTGYGTAQCESAVSLGAIVFDDLAAVVSHLLSS